MNTVAPLILLGIPCVVVITTVAIAVWRLNTRERRRAAARLAASFAARSDHEEGRR